MQMDQEAEAEVVVEAGAVAVAVAVATTGVSMQVSPLPRNAPKAPKQHTMPSFLSQPAAAASPSTPASRRWKKKVRAPTTPKTQQTMSGFLSQPTPNSTSTAVSPRGGRRTVHTTVVSPGGTTAAVPRHVLLPSGLSAPQMERLRSLAAAVDDVNLVSDFTRDVTHVVTNHDRGAIKVCSVAVVAVCTGRSVALGSTR